MKRIRYHFESKWRLGSKLEYTKWLHRIAALEGVTIDALNYVFTTDDGLLKLNQEYLGHDYFTDILTFEYESDKGISGDIYISIDRVMENAREFQVTFENELKRVMVHGLLHLMGFGDKSAEERQAMRNLEDKHIKLFHVEHS